MASTCELPRSENIPVDSDVPTNAGDTSNTSDTSTSDTSSGTTLTAAQRARIERQRQKARALHDARLIKLHPAVKEAVSSSVAGTRARDTGGGFLLEEDEPETKIKKVQAPAPVVHESEQPHCLECDKPFPMSYLFDTFDYSVCDECRNDETHSLITRTEAKTEFLLKDCDLDKRPPPLRCIRRRNPHKAHYSDMRLYLRAQVEARALEVWGSEEALEAEHEAREKRREKAQETSTKRKLRELRMAARSSLFEGRKAIHGHTHEWGEETYDEDSDSYSRVCKTCGHTETYEKM
ncbi:DNA repair protein complementing XP-A cells homolog [Cydia splendana]|uniref:DNA repair protein complementing XP-A cells homolog n=1 Tax=Cydia splendana TaxID=1100963 RepID=UPI0021255E23